MGQFTKGGCRGGESVIESQQGSRSGTIGEEGLTFANFSLDAFLEPSVATIDLLVADRMRGQDWPTNGDHSVGVESQVHGGDKVICERLTSGRGTRSKNVI